MEEGLISKDILLNIKSEFGNILQIKKYNDTLTNDVFYIKTTKKELVLKILVQKDGIIKNIQEHKIIDIFYQVNITANILRYEKDYFIMEYLPTTTLKEQDIDGDIIKKLANIVKTIHKKKIKKEEIKISDIVKLYISNIPRESIFQSNIVENKKYFNSILKEIDKFEKNIAFCHNDLNLNNFLLGRDKKLYVIDFEYAFYNDIYFDFVAIYNMLGKERFDTFINCYGFMINSKKIYYYLLLLDSISVFWFYHMHYMKGYLDKDKTYYSNSADETLSRIKKKLYIT